MFVNKPSLGVHQHAPIPHGPCPYHQHGLQGLAFVQKAIPHNVQFGKDPAKYFENEYGLTGLELVTKKSFKVFQSGGGGQFQAYVFKRQC